MAFRREVGVRVRAFKHLFFQEICCCKELVSVLSTDSLNQYIPKFPPNPQEYASARFLDTWPFVGKRPKCSATAITSSSLDWGRQIRQRRSSLAVWPSSHVPPHITAAAGGAVSMAEGPIEFHATLVGNRRTVRFVLRKHSKSAAATAAS